ncbi:unnamed protein product (mitochondrion) [Plasmodiophora brassicae]|uniref:Uncharacterized protein n=1 Tax=Plasmodiophora brassicae TaxID=37360 RepID=A0A0G4IKV0_PLABS|nr:hypothetical protein PBRA_004594 [Plasmodiophora brassicae]SPR00166.1 unnamed protein product [Plasmodiophora brassicae]
MRTWLPVCAVLALAAAASQCAAGAGDDDEDMFDHDEDRLVPHGDVVVGSVFTDGAMNATALVLGERVHVLAVVRNKGNGDVALTGIQAHLHSPYRYSLSIQNFSVMPFEEHGDVPPILARSFEYRFRPDPSLLPIKYRLTLDAMYNVGGRAHKTSFFNETIVMVEPPLDWSIATVIKVSLALVGVFLAAIAFSAVMKDKSKASSSWAFLTGSTSSRKKKQ